MRGRSIDVFVHHSSVSLEERKAAEDRFAHGTNACIVCTSTLELGIDVGDLDLVFQANAPSTVSSFMQRMGRTGRRTGTTANTAFLCEEPEAVLQAIALIELAREGWVERVAHAGAVLAGAGPPAPGDVAPVRGHQRRSGAGSSFPACPTSAASRAPSSTA